MSHGKHMIATERPDLIDANRSDIDSTSHPLDEHRRGQRPELLSSLLLGLPLKTMENK